MRTPLPLIAALLIPLAGCSGRDAVRDAGDRPIAWCASISPTPTRRARRSPMSASTRRRTSSATARSIRRACRPSSASPTSTGSRSTAAGLTTAPPTLDEALGAESLKACRPRCRSSTPAGSKCAARSIALSLRAASLPRAGAVREPAWSTGPGGDEARPVTLGLGQPYQVAGDGGEEVGPFAAAVRARRAAFRRWPLEPLPAAAPIWKCGGRAERRGEPMLLEVKWSARCGSRSVRCRVRDDGEFSVAREAFERAAGSGRR